MTEIIDEKTGEVKVMRYGEVYRSNVPFRSRTDLKGYSDNEYYEPDTSLTDPSQVLDIKSTVNRMMRGEMVLPSIKAGDYDITFDDKGNPINMTLDEAFDSDDITQSPGFDYADASEIQRELSKAKEDLPTSASQGTAPHKASADGEPVVDKSEQILDKDS